MAGFDYRQGSLFCEDVDLATVAAEVGTPCYVYSGSLLREAYEQLQKALEPLPGGLICYALKANASLALCKILVSLGCGADVVSGGELYRALKIGFPAERIVFAGVGKTEQEIRFAINANIRLLNIESVPELELVDRTAQKLGTKARIALRVNPGVKTDTHPYVATGSKGSKFGLDLAEILPAYQHAVSLSGIQVTGLHFHLGSQITSTEPYVEALAKVVPLVQKLRGQGIPIDELDVGGGLGISYDGEETLTPEQWLAAMRDGIRRSGCKVIIEPGRVLVGSAGTLVTKVLYLKNAGAKNFLVVDTGMNDLLRPSLYRAYHQIWPLRRRKAPSILADVVGPICESADFLAQGLEIARPRLGEMLAVMNTGAYAISMSSNYNGRPRPAEVLVSGDRYAVIKRRETFEDMMANELVPDLVLEVCRGSERACREDLT